jgi:hypothetical protein
MNAKRGFNRLFIVLTVLWAIYWLLGYPIQKQQEAHRAYLGELRDCYEHQLGTGQEFKDCLAQANSSFNSITDNWGLVPFYTREFWFLVFVIAIVPLIVYGLCRGLAAAGLWVWHGFRPPL